MFGSISAVGVIAFRPIRIQASNCVVRFTLKLDPVQPMHDSKLRTITEVKPASIVRMEEEAKLVIDEANMAIEARLAAKAKAKAEDEIREAEARARTKAKAQARAKAIADEEARIEAAGGTQWYYIQKEEQIGPGELVRDEEQSLGPHT